MLPPCPLLLDSVTPCATHREKRLSFTLCRSFIKYNSVTILERDFFTNVSNTFITNVYTHGNVPKAAKKAVFIHLAYEKEAKVRDR